MPCVAQDGQALHAVRCADDTDYERGAVTLVRACVACVQLARDQEDYKCALPWLPRSLRVTPALASPPTSHPLHNFLPQHLYAPPTRRVLLYEPEEDRVVTRVPGFYSRGGRVVKEG